MTVEFVAAAEYFGLSSSKSDQAAENMVPPPFNSGQDEENAELPPINYESPSGDENSVPPIPPSSTSTDENSGNTV